MLETKESNKKESRRISGRGYMYCIMHTKNVVNGQYIMTLYVSGALTSAKCTQRCTTGKKIWLSMHPRNFGSDKIVGTYIHPFM